MPILQGEEESVIHLSCSINDITQRIFVATTEGGEKMDTERTRRIIDLINRLNPEQMDRLERFLQELLGIKDKGKGR